MYPILFKLGPLPIPGYGTALMIGFLISMYLAERDSHKFGIPKDKLSDLFPRIIIGAILGARLFHVFFERPNFFLQNPLDIFKLWDGGVTFYGGLIVCILVVLHFSKKNKVSMLNLSDFLITYVALGQVFGRIGCFLAGCCHGIPTNLPWGITVTNINSVTTPLGVPLHPTQLYQSLWNLLTFLILYRNAKKKRFVGENLLLYGIIYPIGRFIVEIFRGDEGRGYIVGNLSTSQGISLILFVICLSIYIIKLRKISKTKK